MSCASLLWAGPSPSRPEYTRINIRVSPKQWGNDREITVGVRGAVIAKLHSCSNAAVTRSSAAFIDVGSAAHRSCPPHISAWKSCLTVVPAVSGTAVEMEALRLYHSRLQTGNRSSTDFSCELRTRNYAPVGQLDFKCDEARPPEPAAPPQMSPPPAQPEPVRRPPPPPRPPPQPAAPPPSYYAAQGGAFPPPCAA